eukprot:gnl/Hemi2/20698_TR6856_c0_g1_i1.p1 gnl/Hemi2/20698_TR6856_c0_g1~~gnl/Hemi2/20698_TR6856_c0_g1_i1.p1  ORF type:complete len:814 (+),score=271.94 gnl/Hemi2/20698_TR6856_c0_g1_i1:155-2596(+)
MFRSRVLLLLAAVLCFGAVVARDAPPVELDCAIKGLALDFAHQIMGAERYGGLVWDALQFDSCKSTDRVKPTKVPGTRVVPPALASHVKLPALPSEGGDGSSVFYVSLSGSDSAPGTLTQPFRTLEKARDTLRGLPTSTTRFVYLMPGVYYLTKTFVLDSVLDSNTVYISYIYAEPAVLSGGIPLDFLYWYPVAQTPGLFVADVSAIPNFNTLFVNERRAIRARFPNANPEIQGLHTPPATGWVPNAPSWLAPRPPAPGGQDLLITTPQRNGTNFPYFQVGIGGAASVFNPPISYWGFSNPDAGSQFQVPSGLVYNASTFTTKRWANPKTAIVHAFHGGHWGGWQFEVTGRNDATNTLTFGRGGFQEARGASTGAEWYVENVYEETDSANEWFLDAASKQLYYFPNSTATTGASFPNNLRFVAAVLETLVSVRGTQQRPIANITFMGFNFTQTAHTYMNDYEVPSGGDASVHRGATFFAEGVEGLTVTWNVFDSTGGNAVFISNYARNTSIQLNEFVWIGDTAINAVGSSNLMDGTTGNFPLDTSVTSNLVHEVGIFGKQTYFFFQSLAVRSSVVGNIAFNGPRAGINFNDGFGGGSVVSKNLLFNFVRETNDHGQFNSWDRQPYITLYGKASPLPDVTPTTNHITRNFMINNYNSVWPIDHDDGSAFYLDDFNLLIYGGAKNYLGHSKTVQNNLYVYPDYSSSPFDSDHCTWSYYIPNQAGWDEVFTNNTCIVANGVPYGWSGCDKTAPKASTPFTGFNSLYSANAQVKIPCDTDTYTLATWQALGLDAGTTLGPLPDTATLIGWAKDLLMK